MEFDSFTIALLVSGTTPNTDELQNAHLAHLASLHDAGALLAAGPLRDPAGELRGLSLLNVGIEEVHALKAEDPAVRAGVFTIRALPWQVPAGALSFAPTFFPRSMKDVLGR
jgi:uncharacterized protein YciI